MSQQRAAERSAITMDAYRDKVLILSEGNINVLVEQGEAPRKAPWTAPSFWPAVTALAVCVATVSSAVTLYTVYNFQHEMAARLDVQAQRFEDRLNAAFADARSRSDDQVGTLLVRTDDLGTKLDLIPERIDNAAHGMTVAVSDSTAMIRRTLSTIAPIAPRSSPILLIKRRKSDY